MQFTVKVPASTSNLGPGFDTLGLALNLYNEYQFSTEGIASPAARNEDSPAVIASEAKQSLDESSAILDYSSNLSPEQVPYTKENLVYRSFDYLFKKNKLETPDIKIHFEAGIPITGGFGSSSTAIVAGLMAAAKLLEAKGIHYNQEDILRLGTQLDGHPDNITPAIVGGFVVCVYANKELSYIKLPWNQDLFFVVITPDFKTPTAAARAVLPQKINFSDAVHNIGFSSLLVAAVASQNTEILKRTFKDKLHQENRATLVPGMQYVLDTGLEAGAVGTVLSGAGSTLLAIVDNKQTAITVGEAMQTAWIQSAGIKAEYRFLRALDHGAELV